MSAEVTALCYVRAMDCANCGALIDANSQRAGTCRYCDAALVAPAPQVPSLDGAIAQLLSAAAQQGGTATTTFTTSTTTFVIEGVSYARYEDIPAEVRARNADKLAKLEKLGLLKRG